MELISTETINKTKEFLMNRNIERVKVIEKDRNFIGELISYAIKMDNCLIYKDSEPLTDIYMIALDFGGKVKCLYCDGSEVSREEYKELFDFIGTRYGVGDNVTTFNLPNLVEPIN